MEPPPPPAATLRDGSPIPQNIDWSSFRRSIDLVAISVEKKQCNATKTALMGLLLDMDHVKPIINDTSPDRKLLLLKQTIPREAIADESLRPAALQALMTKDQNARLVLHSLQLTVDNLHYDEILRSLLPDDVEVPTSFEIIGHIAHLNLRPPHLPYQHLIGKVLLKKLPALRTIVNKTSNIESEFRTLPLQVIAGDNDLETSVYESGCTLKMNYAEVYWNSRLQAEHSRLVAEFDTTETICDMTAGIGPFAIPAAKHGCRVWANDLNPASYKWLVINAQLNHVTSRLHAFNLDARAFVRKLASEQLFFSRYIVNLPAFSIDFLDVFVGLYPPGSLAARPRPLVHCYCFTNAPDPQVDVIERASKVIGFNLQGDPSVTVLQVRDVSPKKFFMCLTFRVPQQVLERVVATNKRKESEEVASGDSIAVMNAASSPPAAAAPLQESRDGKKQRSKDKEKTES